MPSIWSQRRTPESLFWEKVDKTPGQGPKGECWSWIGARRGNRTGTKEYFYGCFRFRDAAWLAHRVAYVLTHGEIPEGLDVLHSCDFPPCVRPDHLWAGTHKQNMEDSVNKGRHVPPIVRRGSEIPWSKLTEEKVLEIRRLAAEGKSQRALAAQFNVCQNSIGYIVRRLTWKHI